MNTEACDGREGEVEKGKGRARGDKGKGRRMPKCRGLDVINFFLAPCMGMCGEEGRMEHI